LKHSENAQNFIKSKIYPQRTKLNVSFLNCGAVVAKPGLEQLSDVPSLLAGHMPISLITKLTNGQAEPRAAFNFLIVFHRPYITDHGYFDPR
jgi:hypothetical protein